MKRILLVLTLFITGMAFGQTFPNKFVFPDTKDTVYFDAGVQYSLRDPFIGSAKLTLNGVVYTNIRYRKYVPPTTPPPPVNNAPTVNLGVDKTVQLLTGETVANVSLSALATDESPSTLKYQWSTGGSASSITVSQGVGTVTYSVTVIDGGGLKASDDIKVTVLAAPVVEPPTTGRKGIIFESGFENVSLSGTSIKVEKGSSWSNQQHCCSYSVTSAPTARTGTGAVKFELRKGDPLVSGSARSEITGPKESATKFERWYGASFFVTAKDDGLDQSIIQWHQNQDNGIPPMALWITGNKWKLQNTMTGYPGAAPLGGSPGNEYIDLKTDVAIGKWTDIVIHIKWSNQSDGLIEVYVDGVLKATSKGINGYSGGNYMKLGVYKWTWEGKSADGSSRIIYADDIRIGNETSDLKSVSP